MRWPRSGQAEEPPGLVQGGADPVQAAGGGDEVEQVAVLKGGRIGLMFNCT